MKHTLGPWQVLAAKGEYCIEGHNGTLIFTIRNGLIPMREDARLLTAAPDMLDALRLMMREYEALRFEQPERWPTAAAAARAAIAKAEGAE
jgi:hypothetical protein